MSKFDSTELTDRPKHHKPGKTTKSGVLEQAVRHHTKSIGTTKKNSEPSPSDLRREGFIENLSWQKRLRKWIPHKCETCGFEYRGPVRMRFCKDCTFAHRKEKHEAALSDQKEIMQAIYNIEKRKKEIKGKK